MGYYCKECGQVAVEIVGNKMLLIDRTPQELEIYQMYGKCKNCGAKYNWNREYRWHSMTETSLEEGWDNYEMASNG